MRKTSFDLPDDLYQRVNIAAASRGLSSAEFIRASLHAALHTLTEHDGLVAAAFRYMDSQDLAITAERSKVSA
jgi:plasmid stability protein